jgi:hypothetical protein
MYDAANNDNDGDDAILAATEDYNAFKEQYGGYSASISRIESFAYMAASSNENDEPTNPVYGTITKLCKIII